MIFSNLQAPNKFSLPRITLLYFSRGGGGGTVLYSQLNASVQRNFTSTHRTGKHNALKQQFTTKPFTPNQVRAGYI